MSDRVPIAGGALVRMGVSVIRVEATEFRLSNRVIGKFMTVTSRLGPGTGRVSLTSLVRLRRGRCRGVLRRLRGLRLLSRSTAVPLSNRSCLVCGLRGSYRIIGSAPTGLCAVGCCGGRLGGVKSTLG